jgi:transposase
MDELHQHYRQLLGLTDDWNVKSVDLSLAEKRLLIVLEHLGEQCVCPECSTICSLHDHAPARRWRHLDTMQFETALEARVPRVNCPTCGVKTCNVPWAGKHSRFTLLFEAFAIAVLNSASSISAASTLLKLGWDALHQIMKRAVDRGIARRQVDEVQHVGIDEKSFGRGQDYVSLLTDLNGSRVLEVAPGRDEQAANALWKSLPESQRRRIEAVAIDMSQAFENSTRANVPQADIVHDKFHISKNLNEAVDKVRRLEHKVLKQDGDHRLTGSKQLWLYRPDHIPDERLLDFEALKNQQLKTARAWAIKENFRWFWMNCYAGNARKYFHRWYSWASRSRLEPIVKVAKMIKHRLANVLTYFKHHITNAISEGFNSRIQSIKANARGFRNFDNYRTRILFFCGKLDLSPETTKPSH